MGTVNVRGTEYHMADFLRAKWDQLKDGKLAKIDEDRVYIVDGHERTGKSVFTIQQAAYIDPTILDDDGDKLLPRITFSTKETLEAIRNTKSTEKETKVIIFDEAFRGMSTKGHLSQENKALTQALMEMGQSNLMLYIVSPSFYLIEFYPAVLRSKALFHLKKDKKSKKRIIETYNFNKKAKLYQIGVRKGWGYPIHTRLRAYFYNKYPGGADFEQRYRKKKLESLKDTESNKEEQESRAKFMRNKSIYALYKQLGTYRAVAEALKEINAPIGIDTLRQYALKGKE